MASNNIKLIGITGGIGSGKSTAAGIFEKLGAYVIDADEISRGILLRGTPAYDETVSAFGEEVLLSDGNIDRKALAGVAFSSKDRLETLNRITHKYIFLEMDKRINACAKEHKYDIILLDVPLLFADDFPFKCFKTIAVTADREVKLQRACVRDGVPREKIEERLSRQMPDEELTMRADYSIDNSGELNSLTEKVSRIYDIIMKL